MARIRRALDIRFDDSNAKRRTLDRCISQEWPERTAGEEGLWVLGLSERIYASGRGEREFYVDPLEPAIPSGVEVHPWKAACDKLGGAHLRKVTDARYPGILEGHRRCHGHLEVVDRQRAVLRCKPCERSRVGRHRVAKLDARKEARKPPTQSGHAETNPRTSV